METLVAIFMSSVKLFADAALYILLGFFVAGLLRVYIRPDSVAHYFHRGRFRSVLNASLLGVPIPL
jgi:uncharacterized membrane protein YraQ (UPF0718 family)